MLNSVHKTYRSGRQLNEEVVLRIIWMLRLSPKTEGKSVNNTTKPLHLVATPLCTYMANLQIVLIFGASNVRYTGYRLVRGAWDWNKSAL